MKTNLFAFVFLSLLLTGSVLADEPLSKGIGPIKEVKIGPIDSKLAEKGKGLFALKCSACHKIEVRYVGPALYEVTKRRAPEWIMNMMLNPLEMTQNDPIAQELFGTFLVQMTFQNVTQDESRAILEFFRDNDSKPLPPTPTTTETVKPKKGKKKQ